MVLHISYAQDSAAESDQSRVAIWFDLWLGFSLAKRVELYKDMADKLRQGEREEYFLSMRADLAEKYANFWEARILRRIERTMREDAVAFSMAVQSYVPEDEYTMLLSGENSDDLPGALDLICDTRTRVGRMTKAFRKALVEPAGYVAMTTGFLAVASKFVLPNLMRTQEESGSPSTALNIMAWMSQIGTVPGVGLIVLLLSLLFFGIRWSLPRQTGKLRVFLEYMPPWSIYRNIQGYLWICGFLALMKIGVADFDALENQADETRSLWLRERLTGIRELMVRQSMSLPVAMQISGFRFPSPAIIREIEDKWGSDGDYDLLLERSRAWADQIEATTALQIRIIRTGLTCSTMLIVALLMLLEILIGQDMVPHH